MRITAALFVLMIAAACSLSDSRTSDASRNEMLPNNQASLPKIDHIVVVVEENHAYREIIGNRSAPFMNQLAKQGAKLTNHYAVTHPSLPNYLALFSGTTQGVQDDHPMQAFKGDNLAHQLIAHGYTFTGYSEGLPHAGFTGPYDLKTHYARKHNPWVDFTNVPAASNQPMSAFPKQYDRLPTVSFVIPNMEHDIHDGTIKEADDWLKANLAGYVKWSQTHNSMLIVTWDEDDMSAKNKIPTFIVGPMVKTGTFNEKTNHYTILRTIEDVYGLAKLGHSKEAKTLDIWEG